MIEIYKLPQGKIIIGFCDKNLSIGLLEFNLKQELDKHSRPVKEELVQIYGTCIIKLFNKNKFVKEITLKEGEKFEIPANQFHTHFNPTDNKFITLWKFEGDITEIIKNIGKEA